VAGRKRREDVRLVEPVSLLGLSLGDVLLGLVETGEGRPDPAPGDAASTAAENEPALRLRMPDGRVEREPLLGGFWRLDRTGGLASPRVVTRREGKALACKLYTGSGRAGRSTPARSRPPARGRSWTRRPGRRSGTATRRCAR
jgi:hypothetical protein